MIAAILFCSSLLGRHQVLDRRAIVRLPDTLGVMRRLYPESELREPFTMPVADGLRYALNSPMPNMSPDWQRRVRERQSVRLHLVLRKSGHRQVPAGGNFEGSKR